MQIRFACSHTLAKYYVPQSVGLPGMYGYVKLHSLECVLVLIGYDVNVAGQTGLYSIANLVKLV